MTQQHYLHPTYRILHKQTIYSCYCRQLNFQFYYYAYGRLPLRTGWFRVAQSKTPSGLFHMKIYNYLFEILLSTVVRRVRVRRSIMFKQIHTDTIRSSTKVWCVVSASYSPNCRLFVRKVFSVVRFLWLLLVENGVWTTFERLSGRTNGNRRELGWFGHLVFVVMEIVIWLMSICPRRKPRTSSSRNSAEF